jgi:hypothetical protein
MNFMTEKINPYCKKYPGAFIEFTGLITPCCWLVTDKTRHKDLQDFMGEDYKRIFITHNKEDIESAYKKIEDSWSTDQPFKTCKLVCSTLNKEHPLERLLRGSDV